MTDPARLVPIRECLQRGAAEEALEHAESLGESHPNWIDLLELTGQAALAAKRPERAARAFARLVELAPREPRHRNNLAIAFNRSGDPEASEMACREALRLRPDYPEAWHNLGHACQRQHQPALARSAWREAVRLRPDYLKAWLQLAGVEFSLGDPRGALEAARRATEVDGGSAPAWLLLANAEGALRHFPAALDAVERSLSLKDDPAALSVRANLLREMGRTGEAIAAGRALVEREPESAEYWNELGRSLDSLNQLDDALAAYERAIELYDRDRATAGDRWHGARFNRAIALLKRGDFEAGWEEYDHRWESRDLDLRKLFTMPRWRGENLAGRHLIVAGEQGIGDTVQFCRYLQRVREEAAPARLTLAVTRAQAPLFADHPLVDGLVVEDEPIPSADRHCLMLDLPLIFRTRLDTIPARVPYLTVTEAAVRKWADRIDSATAGRPMRIGLAWQGDPKLGHDHHRSFQLEVLAPLFDRTGEGAAWICLQKGAGVDQIAAGGWPIHVLEEPGEERDLLDTAAMVSQMDLVIAPDTMLAHLAGALARPVWMPLSARGEWRWLTERADSPWYPTMRIFRQSQPGDWAGVVERMAGEWGLIAGDRGTTIG